MQKFIFKLLIIVFSSFSSVLFGEQTKGIYGTWEGPWYEGMSSGEVTLVLTEKKQSIRFTNFLSMEVLPIVLENYAINKNKLVFVVQDKLGHLFTAECELQYQKMKCSAEHEGFGFLLELKKLSILE